MSNQIQSKKCKIIGIDASRVSEKETGVEYYSRALLEALFKIGYKNKVILYTKKPLDWKLPLNFKNKVLKIPYLWTQLRLSLEMIFAPPDILFVPSHSLPLIHPKKSVVTIHDLGFKRCPKAYSFWNRLYLNFSTWYSVKTALKIIAISRTTKEDLVYYYKIPSQKIMVIYLGFKKRKIDVSKIPQETDKYILYLGRIDKKKNLKRLIKAFKLVKKEKALPHKFFLIGKDGFGAKEIRKETGDNPAIKFFKHQDDKKVSKFMGGASALLTPSLYEGFGMTALEAFYLGIPVLSSNIKSAREIYKDAALLVNPKNLKAIETGLFKILTDDNLRKKLIKKGRQRARPFSWRKCAEKTLEFLLKKQPIVSN